MSAQAPNDDPQNSNLDDEDNIDKEFTEQSDQIINGERGIKASILPKVGFDQQLPVTGGRPRRAGQAIHQGHQPEGQRAKSGGQLEGRHQTQTHQRGRGTSG